LVGAVHPNRPRAIAVNRPYLIRQKPSAHCKRYSIRKCWVVRFRCSLWKKMSLPARRGWQASNLNVDRAMCVRSLDKPLQASQFACMRELGAR
jgi:hypothetical protein